MCRPVSTLMRFSPVSPGDSTLSFYKPRNLFDARHVTALKSVLVAQHLACVEW
jgi:hypothetical protein